jgi:hypothetical protein
MLRQVLTEEYDGASWTVGGNLNTARGYYPAGAGIQTAALAFGGYDTAALQEQLKNIMVLLGHL